MVKRLVTFVLLSVLAMPAATILSICPILRGEMAPPTEHDCCQRHAGKTPDCHPQPCASKCALNGVPDAVAPAFEVSKLLGPGESVSAAIRVPAAPADWVNLPTYWSDQSSTHLKIRLLRI